MKKTKKKYYCINNTCNDNNMANEGEVFVLLDSKFVPIWHHDYSDYWFEVNENPPKDLTKIIKNDTLLPFENGTKEQYDAIEKYLDKNGYYIDRDGYYKD